VATPSLTQHTIGGVLGEIAIDIRTSDRVLPRPAVLILHGFKGFKDWGMFPPLAERIARAGFAAVSFNVSGSGVDGRGEFVFPERFGHNTYSAELEDIARVTTALAEGTLGLAPTSRFGLIGHSRGGGTAILTAARDQRVQALVTWAAIPEVQRWAGQLEEWRAKGRLDIVNSRTGQVLPLYTDVLDDIERNAEDLDLSRAAARIGIPWLLLHGEEDPAVHVSAAETLAGAALKPPRVMLFPGAGHTFGAVHPWAGLTQDLAQAIDETVKWFGRWL
jgi:alpha-beta hydrolase superfamily lysophospholipase